MRKISIIIPTWKHLECLIPCCQSIIENTDLSNGEVLVVANGCGDDGTREYVESLGEPFKLIWMEEQGGYVKPVNEGIKHSIGSHVILLNNDTKILPEWGKNAWIDILYKPFLEDDKMGITGPMKTFSESAGQEFLIFFCVMISRKVIDAIGLLDESFFSYGEDTSYCIEAQKVGFKIKQVPVESNEYYEDNRMKGNFPIWHAGNISHKNWPGGEELIAKNNAILRERYNKLKANDGVAGYASVTGIGNKVLRVEGTMEELNYDIIKAVECDGFMSIQELAWLAKQVRIRYYCEVGYKKICLELGSWHGRSARAIADNLPEGGVLYCIDTWNGSKAEQDSHHASAKMLGGDHALYEFLQNNFDLVQSGKIIPIRMSSKNATDFFKEKNINFDFVFLDGAHDAASVREDILNWMPLVKEGGILCGHDYTDKELSWIQVKPVVDELFGSDFKLVPDTMIWYREIKKGEVWLKDVSGHGGGGASFRKNTDSKIVYPSDLLTCQNDVVQVISMNTDVTPLGHSWSISKSNIFDCFIFNNEIELLERRLETLFNVVDRFIIVEGKLTHSGNKKELVFHNNLQRFEKYLSKITYLVVEENEFPFLGEGATVTDRSWAIERFQRDAIMRGLKDCKDNDIIIISDCDEIPNPEKIKEFKVEDGIKSFSMDLFYYDEFTKAKDKWNEAKICTYKILKEKSPCGVRYTKIEDAPLIENGGVHLSYQGGIESIIHKIENTAHQELNTEIFKSIHHIKDAIENGKDLFDRPNIKFERL